MTLEKLQANWVDSPKYHKHISELFTALVNLDPQLNEHRTFVEENVYGMGERAFQWFWKLMVDELPDGFKFLEIGVHKAQVLSLIRMISQRLNKNSEIFGITPMDGTGTGWTEDNYESDIAKIHTIFKLSQPVLHKGLSGTPEALRFALSNEPYDVVYIDGDHTYDGAMADLVTYAQLVKNGGYLVIDDACCDLNFPPSGFFTGIDTVTEATLDYLKKHGYEWEFMFNVVHIRVYKRK